MSEATTQQFWVLSENEAYESGETFRGMFSTLELAQAGADKLAQLPDRGGWSTTESIYGYRFDKFPAGVWVKVVADSGAFAYIRDARNDFRYWIEPFAVDQLCNYQVNKWRLAPDEKDEQA